MSNHTQDPRIQRLFHQAADEIEVPSDLGQHASIDRSRQQRRRYWAIAGAAAALLVGVVAIATIRPDAQEVPSAASPNSAPEESESPTQVTVQNNGGIPAGSDPPQPAQIETVDPTYQRVVDLLPGDSWVGLAVTPDGHRLAAYDLAGRRVSFVYIEFPDAIAQSDLDDDGTKLVRDEAIGDAVAVNCFLDVTERVLCDTADQGLPALRNADIAAAGSELLPLLRQGVGGPLNALIKPSSGTAYKPWLEDALAQALDSESVWISIDPDVVTAMDIGKPLPLTAPDGSTVVSVVDGDGVLYRIRTDAGVSANDVVAAVPGLLEMVSTVAPITPTTLPG